MTNTKTPNQVPLQEELRSMQEDDRLVKETIRRDNKRARRNAVIVFIAAGISGGIIGFLVSFFSGWGEYNPQEAVVQALIRTVPVIAVLTFFICVVLTFLYYKTGRRLYESCDEDDEAAFLEAEHNFSKGMLVVSVGVILNLFCLGVEIYAMEADAKGDEGFPYFHTIMVFVIALIQFTFLFCQRKLVDYIRLKHPEKRGSVYDVRFQKIWLESCDEAEKMKIYQSGYAAYTFINKFLVVLWAIAMFLIIGFQTGLLAMTMISAAWLALNLVYSLKAMKLE